LRDYRQQLDGFSAGEVVSLHAESHTRWKIEKLWLTTWCGRELRLATIVLTDLGGSLPRHQRRIGTRKESIATAHLMKIEVVAGAQLGKNEAMDDDDDDGDKKAVRGKIAGIFDKMLDRYEESMHERILRSWCMIDVEERKHRLRTVEDLSVELHRIRTVSIQATGLGEGIIGDVIEGDWKNAEATAGDLAASCGADPALWEGFIILVRTAAAESQRLARGVKPEGN